MCVAGKCFNDSIELPPSKFGCSIGNLIEFYGQEKLFKPEIAFVFTKDEWYYLQRIHDSIATETDIQTYVKSLNLFTLEELQNFNQNELY